LYMTVTTELIKRSIVFNDFSVSSLNGESSSYGWSSTGETPVVMSCVDGQVSVGVV